MSDGLRYIAFLLVSVASFGLLASLLIWVFSLINFWFAFVAGVCTIAYLVVSAAQTLWRCSDDPVFIPPATESGGEGRRERAMSPVARESHPGVEAGPGGKGSRRERRVNWWGHRVGRGAGGSSAPSAWEARVGEKRAAGGGRTYAAAGAVRNPAPQNPWSARSRSPRPTQASLCRRPDLSAWHFGAAVVEQGRVG